MFHILRYAWGTEQEDRLPRVLNEPTFKLTYEATIEVLRSGFDWMAAYSSLILSERNAIFLPHLVTVTFTQAKNRLKDKIGNLGSFGSGHSPVLVPQRARATS